MSSPALYPKFHAFDPSTGLPLVGGKLFTYVAGTSTPQATYSDAALTVANANPVILDANGEAVVYTGALNYKFVLQKSDGSAVWTFDNYAPNIANVAAGGEWYAYTGTAVMSGANGFRIVGVDATAIFHAGRRVRSTNTTSGTVYSTVVSSTVSGSDTVVTVVNDSGFLDPGFSALAYGVTSYVNPSYLDPRTAVCAYVNANATGFAARTQITAYTEEVDALNEFNAGTFTAKYPGVYLFTFSYLANDTAGGVGMVMFLNVNGVDVASIYNTSVAGTVNIHGSMQKAVKLNAGDTVRIFFLGSANTTLNATGTVRPAEFNAVRIA